MLLLLLLHCRQALFTIGALSLEGPMCCSCSTETETETERCKQHFERRPPASGFREEQEFCAPTFGQNGPNSAGIGRWGPAGGGRQAALAGDFALKRPSGRSEQ